MINYPAELAELDEKINRLPVGHAARIPLEAERLCLDSARKCRAGEYAAGVVVGRLQQHASGLKSVVEDLNQLGEMFLGRRR